MTRALMEALRVGHLAAFMLAAKEAGVAELKLTTDAESKCPNIYFKDQGKQVAQWKQETKGRPRQ